jgi:hypothetical protein
MLQHKAIPCFSIRDLALNHTIKLTFLLSSCRLNTFDHVLLIEIPLQGVFEFGLTHNLKSKKVL